MPIGPNPNSLPVGPSISMGAAPNVGGGADPPVIRPNPESLPPASAGGQGAVPNVGGGANPPLIGKSGPAT
jgi:hypothetical protein